jgi:hypothetical protein
MKLDGLIEATEKRRVDTLSLSLQETPPLWRNFRSEPLGYTADLFTQGEISPALRASA